MSVFENFRSRYPVQIVEPKPSNPAPQPLSEDLLHQRDEAQKHFHEAREHVEQANDSSEYRHQERVNEATEHFRKAEEELEKVEKQIVSKLPPPVEPPSTPPTEI